MCVFAWGFLGIFYTYITSSASRNSFIIFLPNLYFFISFFNLLQCLDVPVLCCLGVVHVSEHPDLVPGHRGRAFSPSRLSVMIAVGFL